MSRRTSSRSPRGKSQLSGENGPVEEGSCLIITRLFDTSVSEEVIERAITDIAIEEGFSVPTSVVRPRGKTFAFVEFSHVEAARQFMAVTKKELKLYNKCYTMEYSKSAQSSKSSTWNCPRCRFVNFANRKRCKKCDSEQSVSNGSTTLVLKGFTSAASALRVETVQHVINQYAPVLSMRYIASKKIAFLEFPTLGDSAIAFAKFNSLLPFPELSIEYAYSTPKEHYQQESLRDQLTRLLQLCPAMAPFEGNYVDPTGTWLLDPTTLYWYHQYHRSYYKLVEDPSDTDDRSMYKLVRVDAMGSVETDPNALDLELPMPVCKLKPADIIPRSYEDAASTDLLSSETVIDQELHRYGRVSTRVRVAPIDCADDICSSTIIIAKETSNYALCYLCKRKFPSPEALTKHTHLSKMHKDNLAIQNQTNS